MSKRRYRGGYGKSTRNPEAICDLCGKKIFNKLKGSLFCKDCSKVVFDLRGRLESIKYTFRHHVPDYEFNFKLVFPYESARKKLLKAT